MPQFRPLKGVPAPTDLTMLRYPLLASEKLDGWRALVAPINWAREHIPCAPKHREYFTSRNHCIALSASLKPISNWYVQEQLDSPALAWCDGELIASERFNETSSAFASHGGEPAFQFHIFDTFEEPSKPFGQRLIRLSERWLPHLGDNVDLYKHPHFEMTCADELQQYIEEELPKDAEGAVTRCPFGPYKFGRATEKQGWLLKLKPFVDAEAVVVGVEELMHNWNDPEVSQLGLQRRSSHKDGKVGGEKLGALRCKPLGRECEIHAPMFRIGTGFTDAERCLLWAQRDELFGRIVVYKSMKAGALNAPRHPVFRGFRYEDHS
jgi:DNA ligase-1